MSSWFSPLFQNFSTPEVVKRPRNGYLRLNQPMDYDALLAQMDGKPFTRSMAAAKWEICPKSTGSRLYIMKKKGLIKPSLVKTYWEKA